MQLGETPNLLLNICVCWGYQDCWEAPEDCSCVPVAKLCHTEFVTWQTGMIACRFRPAVALLAVIVNMQSFEGEALPIEQGVLEAINEGNNTKGISLSPMLYVYGRFTHFIRWFLLGLKPPINTNVKKESLALSMKSKHQVMHLKWKHFMMLARK